MLSQSGRAQNGVSTAHQIHTSEGVTMQPGQTVWHDLSKQIKELSKQGKRIILLMDVNNHPLHNKFYTLLNDCRTNMEEFSHKCWGPNELYTYHSGKSLIIGGYKLPEVEFVNRSMLNFVESPGNHSLSLANSGTRFVIPWAASRSQHRWTQWSITMK